MSMPKFVNRPDLHLTKATVIIFSVRPILVDIMGSDGRMSKMTVAMDVDVNKNVIERPISVKHLTPPPFQGPPSSSTSWTSIQQTLGDYSLPCAGNNGIGADVFLNGKERSIVR